jgi:hypothetical protein
MDTIHLLILSLFSSYLQADYVILQLKTRTGDYYDIQQQFFDVVMFNDVQPPTLVRTSPSNEEFVAGKDFLFMGNLLGYVNVTGYLSYGIFSLIYLSYLSQKSWM